MTPTEFSTHGLPPRQQLDAWRSSFDPVFDVVPDTPSDEEFLAASRMWTLDGLAFGRVSAPAIRVTRTKALIRRNPIDHWVVTLGQRGTTALSADGTSFQAPAGTPFVLSLGQELVSARGADERLQLYLSRDAFHGIATVLDAARGLAIEGGLGTLLAEYLQMLERNMALLDAADAARLKDAVAAMIGACIAPSPERLAAAAQQIDLGRLEKVRRAVRRYLRSPALGPGLLCRHVGTSRSQLYRLMEAEGGVARYIQRQRLDEAYALICEFACDKPITVIAEELCFADASGFSRAFRQEFGASPRDVRAAARAGFVPAAASKAVAAPRTATLSDALRGAS